MRPFKATISLDEARRRLNAAVAPIARTETVPLAVAAGRVAAADVTSSMDVPPFARAAMDGYAVLAADTTGASRERPVRLRIAERVYTAEVARAPLTPGTSIEIATGAPVPDGADAVVMVEETALEGEHEVRVFHAAKAGQNIGRRGADIAKGAIVVRAGDLLTPGSVGAVAAIGAGAVDVYARPRVAILSTGNEIVAPGRKLRPGQIYDVNRYTLTGLVAAHGGDPEAHRTAHDTLDALTRSLNRCLKADLVVFSGGTSVGERDLILDLLAARGEVVFHGIDVKPGKPTAFAMVDGKPFFGMPGYPTSCLLNGYIFLVPFLRATARLPPFVPRRIWAPLTRRIQNTSGRHQFYTVRLVDGAVQPAFKASGDITSLSQADGYIEIPADLPAVEDGTLVDVTLF